MLERNQQDYELPGGAGCILAAIITVLFIFVAYLITNI